jgi:hypothetical protein
MSKLGISETQFAAIADSDFTASSSTVFICEIQDSTIVIRSEKGTLSDDEISSLMKPVQILLSQFNNQ